MKKVLLIFMLTLFTLWSCKDSFLEFNPPPNRPDDASMFKTADQFNTFIIGTYTELLGIADWIQLAGFVSQDVLDVGEQRKVLSAYMVPTEGKFKDYWQSMYIMINRANILLEKLEVAPAEVAAADRARIEGEAKFLRGFSYFNIARAYGNAPLLLNSYSPAQTVVTCTPEAQIWDQVILDLKAASEKLPQRWDDANLGRATKGAALAFLANAYMYKEDWAKAAEASEALIALGQYRLEDNVRKVFSINNENNPESIFEVQFREGGYEWSNNKQTGSLIGAFTAPRNIGGDYAPFGAWGEAVLDKAVEASMEPGDDRGIQLIKTLGDKYKGEQMSDTIIIGNMEKTPDGKQQGEIPQRNVDWSTKYWLGRSTAVQYHDVTGSNVPVMRYAEFLLNYAEILFELGQPNEAYEKLNLVHTRAKLPLLPVSGDKEVFMTALMNERRWELIMEPNLWFHYTRTGRAAAFMAEKGIAFDPKWNKFPIPQADRDQNPKLCQNKDY